MCEQFRKTLEISAFFILLVIIMHCCTAISGELKLIAINPPQCE